ncbi:MAG: hypothetical protein KC620_18270, partial [Myxococcales bacterium]|nr:hypothetical protein [Myxococcales bacterium]
LAYELCDLATPEEKRLLGADMQPLVAEMATVGRAAFMEAEVAAYDAWLVFGAVLERHHAFICPTVTTTDIPFDWELEAPIEIDGAPADRFTTTMLFNMFGNCPALTVPSGFAENGVPTGLQIAGRTFDDEMVFRIGAALERQAPLYDHAARRPALTGAGASTKRSN